MKQRIICGECLDEMRKMEDNSIDFIVCDPPYGVSFMNKAWDRQIPPIEYWKEMLRIIKPGGHLCVAGLPRMIHRLTCVIEDAGFQIRDMIMHLFGSGFPKSHNKFGLEGYGTALKPAWEGWVLAMKLLDGTYAQNAEKWGVGGININESRIFGNVPNTVQGQSSKQGEIYGKDQRELKKFTGHKNGRWPANLILDPESAEMLDQQTGKSISKSGGSRGNNPGMWKGKKIMDRNGYNDSGGASRFFYCPKASSAERQGSKHPTIKPKKLISYIIKLLAPPGDPICLDPFMGSGTCGVACKELGIRFIGIELEKEYFEDAKKRISLVCAPQCDLFDSNKQDSQSCHSKCFDQCDELQTSSE